MYHHHEAAVSASAPNQPEIGEMGPPRSRKHRVVLESVTQEKKKLRSVLTFEAKPPPGYTFIPAGHPELTAALKEFARQGNHKIYAVSTTRHQDTHDLSKEVHRIGFHFPTLVVDQVCAHYGISLSASGTLIKDTNQPSFRHRRKSGKQQNPAEEVKDQTTINTEARDAIKDLFPNIPDNDLYQIIKTAFQRGQKKVGTAVELPLIRRAQLSVVAHIRHVYTKYDSLLKRVQWNEARGMVEGPTLRKLVEWRGDDDDNSKEKLEDVLREVIVISDDEASDDDLNDEPQSRRRASVEIISHSADDQQIEVLPFDYSQAAPSNGRDPYDHSGDDAPAGYWYVPQVSRRRSIDQPGRSRRVHRYDAWDRAREQYRAAPQEVLPKSMPEPRPNDDRVIHRHPDSFAEKASGFGRVEQDGPYRSSHPVNVRRLQDPIVIHPRSPPTTFRGADGFLYERSRAMQPEVDRARPASPPQLRPLPTSERVSGHDTGSSNYVDLRSPTKHQYDSDSVVLPSIENTENMRPSPPLRQSPPPYHRCQNERGDLQFLRRLSPDLPREIEVIDLSSPGDRQAKRRRVDKPFSDVPVRSIHDSVHQSADSPFAQSSRYVQPLPDHLNPSSERRREIVTLVEPHAAYPAQSSARQGAYVVPGRAPPTVPVFHDQPPPRQFDEMHRVEAVRAVPIDRSHVPVSVHSRSVPHAQIATTISPRSESFIPSTWTAQGRLRHEYVSSSVPEELIHVQRESPERRIGYANGHVVSSTRPSIIELRTDGTVDTRNKPVYSQLSRYREIRQGPVEIIEHVQPVQRYVAVDSTSAPRRVPIELGTTERTYAEQYLTQRSNESGRGVPSASHQRY